MTLAHARIKYPRPLAAPTDGAGGNFYNEPLKPDGRDFPCKGLHKKAGVSKTPTTTWTAGQEAYFEILGHNSAGGGEGSLAAHSGGSCQASLSFDDGETWKVLHSYHGGCPRGVRLGSNMAGPNQTFSFLVPEQTRTGTALFSWTWIAVTGNRNEMFQNCASVMIDGSGASMLEDFPDMFVGDMSIAGHIGPGECRSSSRTALEYPNPGNSITIDEVPSIPFKKPTAGKCYSKATVNNATMTTLSTTVTSTLTSSSSSSTVSTAQTTDTDAKCENPTPTVFSLVVNDANYPCTCTCEKRKP
ncbi:unnamed protein product [Rotaria magnacalcarata]|uniref:Lytic polysaccharide monooxygenase n=5 Tax=Rotaria magnacalcarata TaxID=392030 RepID=A0A814V987_9BILA|nr:unnamed protein product [Rotaria magnacalcarata]CAF1602498.1 unnamed protein product [Rotaria magnacalcarata]CAF2075091.1 unnamed protein product [Rotaria magnacalcarata]CAF4372121.1 unnamed protein product [Rotaria magnacalcarata]